MQICKNWTQNPLEPPSKNVWILCLWICPLIGKCSMILHKFFNIKIVATNTEIHERTVRTFLYFFMTLVHSITGRRKDVCKFTLITLSSVKLCQVIFALLSGQRSIWLSNWPLDNQWVGLYLKGLDTTTYFNTNPIVYVNFVVEICNTNSYIFLRYCKNFILIQD